MVLFFALSLLSSIALFCLRFVSSCLVLFCLVLSCLDVCVGVVLSKEAGLKGLKRPRTHACSAAGCSKSFGSNFVLLRYITKGRGGEGRRKKTKQKKEGEGKTKEDKGRQGENTTMEGKGREDKGTHHKGRRGQDKGGQDTFTQDLIL
jgi:hypothetical protein